MSSLLCEHLYTLEQVSQLPGLFKGRFFRGRSEPRVAFLGRSNVGKSSLLNGILHQKLAFTSQHPGKTKAIQFFSWPTGKKILVDLPGYGFAKRSYTAQKAWGPLLAEYFRSDSGLQYLLLLIDARRGLGELDRQFFDFLSPFQLPFGLVFTKQDAFKNQKEAFEQKKKIQHQIQQWELQQVPIFWTSVHQREGVRELTSFLQKSLLERNSLHVALD